MYIVKYSEGEYDSYCVNNIFVTCKKSTATKYVTKFKKKLKKWKEYYKRYEEPGEIMDWIADEYINKLDRWYQIKKINDCWWEEISKR